INEEFPVNINEVPVDNLVPASELRVIPDEEVVQFRRDSPYASVLKECALADEDSLCTNAVLPYIGQDHPNPTINDILNRVLVSHQWMGIRFAQLLKQMPEDTLALFRPVTVITIGSDVRPSSFSSFRGSVRLDPRFLWLTLSEKQTISTAPDYRSGFGADLRFLHRWSYMINNERPYSFYSLTDDSERTLNDIVLRTSSLLFHELAHANDYVNPTFFNDIDPEETPRDLREKFADRRVSQLLYDDISLSVQASWLYALASVRYRDDEPDDDLLAFTADSVGAVMGNEGKTEFYSYSTIREDMANLFETAMMKKHYGVELYTSFVEKPPGYPDDYSVDELIVGWGERNRLAAPLVAPRAKYVVDKVFGDAVDNNNFFNDNLGVASPLPTGGGWYDIIDPPSAQIAARSASNNEHAKQLELEFLRDTIRSPDDLLEH
ncbi:MAG: hypothetical protein KTR35_22110, partial [Gammaproteobacteria bacterium]|nr:hypothetical protein [Gammaproteobacteria bacterium]